ncbi:MAG TPA: CHAT domain-containing protein, partial [Desulfobulbus sp.]|nr:CHAT domain-containing protein [Desulfobulbus sp.]
SVKAHLAVIKGDIEPTGIFKKISLFFLDRFYESDHDLVVNTPSMDGGARREKPVPVLFDQGNDINHFRYFENSRTRNGLLAGLTDRARPPRGFILEAQQDVHIARMAAVGPAQTEDMPTVFVLPGITGSYLSIAGDRIWIDFFDLVRGRFTDLRITARNVEARQPVPSVYGDLIDYLGKSHIVIPYGYDWRKSVLETGLALGRAVEKQLDSSTRPVRILAHSMGGLVTRAMMSRCPQTWERMRNREGSRILMLGTPNRGSYSIPRIFARQERMIQTLALADLRHDQDQLLDVLRKFPGILELLPVDDNGRMELNDELWDKFKTIFGRQWKRPTETALNKARKTWRQLFKVELDPEVVSYVAGHAETTPISVRVEESGPGSREVRFTATTRGDGRVPWETGIPKGINHWFVNAVHGDIPDYRPAYKAFVQILETGSTTLLATQPPVARGLDEEQILPPDRVDIFPDQRQLLAAGMGKDIHGGRRKRPARAPLQVSVIHGNLCFARSPLAVGHYQGDTIVSAEAALDERLDHRLSRRQRRGVYPGPLMTSEILLGDEDDNFPGAVIVGLGIVGDLTPGGLTRCFRDAVIRFGLICREKKVFRNQPIALSTLLIGTGARRLSVRDSVTAVLRAVLQANTVLAGPADNADLTISRLDFIELYEDIAIDAQYALLECRQNIEFVDTVTCEQTITEGDGGRTRAHFIEDAQWWQRLRIEGTADGGLKYTAFSDRARADMRIQPLQRQSIEPFLKELTTQTSASKNAGRVLFELMVPAELKGQAAENRRLVLVVDATAASYPWELMEYAGREGNQALAIKTGMIRQLATRNIVPAHICSDLNALVAGDPFSGSNSRFPELPGAQEEAREVARVFEQGGVEIRGENLLIRKTGVEILSRLMTGRFGILHLAGHGVVDYEVPEEGPARENGNPEQKKSRRITGMVIGDNQFLTPMEIRQMPVTPAFVFINCCYLGKIKGGQEQYMEKRYQLAANLAGQLIEQGVKAVVAAGWAVNDGAARTFARTFYTVFLQGRSFGDAVKEARATTRRRHPTVNTWGAYQCYGDPGYSITEQLNRQEPGEIQPFVSLAEYVVALKNITEDAKTASGPEIKPLQNTLKAISGNLPEQYAGNPALKAALKKARKKLGLQ